MAAEEKTYLELSEEGDGSHKFYEVTVRGKTARCTCNGEVLEEAHPVPASGGIGLQSETNLLEYRNIRFKEHR